MSVYSQICPTFVLPYKRFASSSLLPLANNYLEQDKLSLERAVAPQGRIGYVRSDDQQKIDERTLNRSTLWRFLQFLGTQSAALQCGLQLYREYDPLSTLHRFDGAVAPHKHRSQQRCDILCTARRLLNLQHHWDRAFSESFFPRFATRSRAP